MRVYQQIASSFQALLNCEKHLNTCQNPECSQCASFTDWTDRHRERIEDI